MLMMISVTKVRDSDTLSLQRVYVYVLSSSEYLMNRHCLAKLAAYIYSDCLNEVN